MAQQGHITVREVPIDLTANLVDGSYIAQLIAPYWQGGVGFDRAVLYATADVAPTDSDDWFHVGGSKFFTFSKGEDVPPTWVMLAPEYVAAFPPDVTDPTATLAIASYEP